ncbi:MAG: outer membrane beta-barrel protein [Bacteroidota bacterium]
MKNSLRYSKLWQKKRGELKIDTDAGSDWQQMQGLLDQHLPQAPGSGSSSPGSTSGASGFLGTGSIAGLVIVAAAIVYLVAHFAGSKMDKQHRDSSNVKQDSPAITQKQVQVIADDSLRDGNAVATNKDSMALIKQQEELAKTGSTIVAADKNNSTSANGNRTVNAAIGAVDNKMDKDSDINGAKSKASKNNGSPGSSALTKANATLVDKHGRPMVNPNHFDAKGRAINPNGVDNNNAGKGGAGVGKGNKPVNHTSQNPGDKAGNSSPGLGSVRPSNGRGLAPNSGGSSGRSGSTNPHSLADGGAATNSDDHILNNLVAGYQQFDTSVWQQRSFEPVADPFYRIKRNAPRWLVTNSGSSKIDASGKPPKIKKEKKPKNPNDSSATNLDWGLLTGVSTSGSFTDKSQNKNFYGSLPVDLYLGLFGTYHVSDKLAVNLQVRGLTPQTISGGYSHANGSKVDSGKILQVTDSRKAWFVTMPVHLVYKFGDNFSIKAGPVINIPVRQISGSYTLSPTTLKKDTVYYTKTIKQLDAAKYDQKINLGLSGGIGLQYQRFNIEATYFKSFNGYKVISDFGNYTSNSGSVQITVGFKLNRMR